MQFKIHSINKEGFPVEIIGEWPDEYDQVLIKLTDPDFGYTPQIVQTPRALPNAAPEQADTIGGPICQFDGKPVTGTPAVGGRGPFSAQQVAASRAEKMGKMGQKAAPVCGSCWNKGGHKARWDAWYAANSGF